MSLRKKKSNGITVEIYSKEGCHLCDEAKIVLLKIQKKIPFELSEVDIKSSRDLFETFKEQIPVVFINGRKAFKFKVVEAELEKKLSRFL